MIAQRHFTENMELLQREWNELVLHTEQAGRMQQADQNKVNERIRACVKTQGQLWSAMHEPLLRAINLPLMKGELAVPTCKKEAGDSNTPNTSSKPVIYKETQAREKIEGQGSHSKPSSQPSTSGVKEEEINLRPMTGTSKINTNKSEALSWQYPRVWMLPGTNPHEVKQWYDFGELASIQTMSPGFPEIKCIPKWIQEAVQESWANNDMLSRGDVLELYFISAAPEPVGKGNHEAFHYIRLQRLDSRKWGDIRTSSEEIPLIASITEDQISTRRAWGLWVCLTEMDKVKFPFKFFHNSANVSFLLNTMTGRTTRFAEDLFEKKRSLIWESKLAMGKETHRKYCNMAHFGQWDNRVCSDCQNQKEPEFEKGFRPRMERKRAGEDKHPMPKARMLRAPPKK
ncbi:hypothetical protein C2S51_025120 [Perilla frutescens var. frutescens]|nr:hypothetical protein C2S51_025120 [Perilla frutescens var. frutescens]